MKDDNIAIKALGRIAEGSHVGWHIYIDKGPCPLPDPESNEDGYIVYKDLARDFSGDYTWWAWFGDLESLLLHVAGERWVIDWLPDEPPQRFR